MLARYIMIDLKKESMEAWWKLLPSDFKKQVSLEDPGNEGRLVAISERLAKCSYEEVVEILETDADLFIEMGRARRIRFLAWMASRTYPDSGALFRSLTSESEDEGDQEGARKIAPYFKEDIMAIVQAIGPRAAKMIMNQDNLNQVVQASYEIQSRMQPTKEGGL